MRKAHLRSPSEGLYPDSKSDRGESDTTLCGSLWDQAILRLDKKQQSIVTEIRNGSCKPDELLIEVNKEVEKCESRQWSIYETRSGRRIFLRDVLGRIAGFLQKVTAVGDTLVQYDPGHLSIPWAFARFLLVAAVSDVNSYGAFLESMEMVTDTISRYVIIESLYLEPGLDCSAKLEDAIVSLYTAILKYLCKAKLYFGHNTMVRVGISVLKVEQDASKLMGDISSQEETVEKWMALNGAQQTFRTSVGVSDLNGALADFRKVSDERVLTLQNTLLEMQKPVCRMACQMDYIYSSIEGNEKARIIKWISSLGKDYEKNHTTKARYRLKDSGQWLLRNQKYRHWLNISSCSVLWLHGGAGYGKSFLVSLVVDRIIQQRQENPQAAYLAYFYCTRDTAEPKRAQPVEILRSIIRQLSCLSSQTPIRRPVIEKWNERVENESDHGLDMEECVSLLLDLTRDNPAIICIDALDECDISTRRELLEAIGTVINCSEQIVKVFVSSRREDDFLDYFDRWEALEISAKENREDIVNFIDEELKRSKANKTLLHGNVSEQLINDIKQVLLDGADGMFRWVSACLQTLCDPRIVLEKEVREALGTLPKELKDVYDIICSQIERRTPVARTMAENVLKWLLYANKPLSCNEMIKAASMEPDTTVDQVLSLCCNFVKLDEEIGVFQFVHLSVREYLEKRPEYETAWSHAAIAQSCLQACLTNLKPKRRASLQNSQNKTFYDYAQVFWPLHCQLAREYRRQPPLETSFRTFLCTGKFPSKQFSDWINRWSDSWFQMELETRRGAEMGMLEKLNDCLDTWRYGNTIFVACVFGFTEVIDARRQEGMGHKDSITRNNRGRDPYEVAIRYGQEDVINILRSTTNLDSPAARESALLSAVALGEMPMVTMLLNDHSDLEINEEIIAAAVSTCDVPMLKFLADRYLDFAATERLLLIAASNESHGQHIVKFLVEEGGDEIEDIDKTALLEAACDNGPCSLEIVQYIIDNMDELPVTEDVMKAASRNQFDGYQILRALLKLDNDVTITEDIIEAAVCNTSAEPLRLLLSRFPTSPVTWIILNTAARNAECGNTLLTMLLCHSSEAVVDEDLLLAAVTNEKLALKLLDVLLPRATATAVTNDVLKAAAQNRFFGHSLIELLLKHVPGLLLEPSIIEAGSGNLYYAPEVVEILLEYDSAVMVTTLALEEAAANNECGVETLELLLQRKELSSKPIHSSPDQQSHIYLSDTPENPPLVPPEVVEAAALNSESGTDVMELLLKWSDNLTVSSKAVENAAGNPEFGIKIIELWVAHNRVFEVTPRAIKRAAGNHNIGQEMLSVLLRRNRRVIITEEALEIAVMNPYHGFQMVKTMFPRWKGSDGFEEIVSRAARNAQGSIQIITYLLKQQKGSITSDIIESCATSPFADKEMMTLLLGAAPGIPLGLETVEAASNRPQHFFDIIDVLRAHDHHVPITKEAMYAVVRRSYNIIETIQQLKKYHNELTITEGLLKSAVQNINANEATIVYLCHFQKEQQLTDGTLPVTEEVMAAALQNSGNGAVSMVKILLTLQTPEDWHAGVDDSRLEVAINSYRAEAMVSLLVRDAQQHHRVLGITRIALRNAARRGQLKILLKMLSENDKENITAPEVLKAAARSKTQLGLLINYASEQNLVLPINQAVFESSLLGTREAAQAVIKFWESSGQSTLVEACTTEKALEVAASNLRFSSRADGIGAPETSIFHWLFRMQAERGVRIPLTDRVFQEAIHGTNLLRAYRNSVVEYFQRILSRRGGDLMVRDLITTEALKMASGSYSELVVSQLLNVLPEEKRDQLLTRDVLLAAAGSGSYKALNFLLKQKDFQQYSNYYRDIAKFQQAAYLIFTDKERAFLRRGVYPNAPTISNGRTMLSFAAGYNEVASIRVFMKFPGFDLNAVDYEGKTALHFACIRGAETVVELLLARGADTTIEDNHGVTAEGHAIANSHFMVARMVRDYEAAKETSKEIAVR